MRVLFVFVIFLITTPVNAAVVINEFMTSNSKGSGFSDQFGNYPDWIELYNTSNSPVNLQGWRLERDGGDRIWTFPDFIIEPHSHILIAASGENITETNPPAQPYSNLSQHAFAYADDSSDPPGNSSWDYNLFDDSVVGEIDGQRVLSASFDYQYSSELGYGYAGLQMGFNGTSNHIGLSVDLTDYNYLVITAQITESMRFNARIMQAGLDTWIGYAKEIVGTGDIQEYHIPLRGDTSPLDLSVVTGIVFEATDAYGERTIDIYDITFHSTQEYLHTSFPLSQSGTMIALRNSSGIRVDSKNYPEVPTDVSIGRLTDGGDQWGVFIHGTPGEENENGFIAVAETVRFSHKSDFYNSPFNISLSKIYPASRIYYTTDGSDPTENSSVYTQPIEITGNTVVKARIFCENMIPGKIISKTYLFDSPRQIGVVSLSVDPNSMFHPDTGMYSLGPNAETEMPHYGANFWDRSRETPVHIELFEPEGSPEQGFNLRAGLKIYGGWSRANEQKSLAIHFRNRYEESNIDYPVFPHKPHLTYFNDIILRMSGNDQSYTMFRDAMIQTLMDGILDYHQFRPVSVYINGEYWGLYNIRERTNIHYFITNYDGVVNADSVDCLQNNSEVRFGSNSHYVNMLEFAENNNLSNSNDYQQIKEMMDVHNYIDYISIQLYSANADWPGNNIRYWRERPNGKWRWILQDLDYGFNIYGGVTRASNNSLARLVDADGPDWPNPPWSTLLFRNLIENEEFSTDFVNRYATLMNTRFQPERVVNLIDEMSQVISSEMRLQRRRWSYWNDWDEEVEKLRSFARERIHFARSHIAQQFNLGSDATVNLNAENGVISINDFILEDYPFTGDYFAGTPVRLKAIGNPGYMFSQWSDGNPDEQRIVDPADNIDLEALFDRDPNYVSVKELPDKITNSHFSKTENLSVFPVPANNNLSIAYYGEGIVKDIAIYNITGKMIKKLTPSQNSTVIGEWDLYSSKFNRVERGIYFVAIEVLSKNGKKSRYIKEAVIID